MSSARNSLYVGDLKAAAVPHARQLGVRVSQCHGGGVNVVADALERSVLADLVQGLLALFCPDVGGHKVEVLGGKAAAQAGARFSAFWAASMTSVPEPQNGSCTRESRRTRPRSAMAAASVSLMGASVAFCGSRACAGRRRRCRGRFPRCPFAQGKAHLVQCAVLGQGADLVAVHQALDDGLLTMLWQAGTLDSWLDRLEPFDRERRIGGQQVLPRDVVAAVEQLVKRRGLVGSQQQQDALRRAQVQVGGGDNVRPPWNATRPSVTWMFCAPRRLTSKFSVDSVPKNRARPWYKV